MTGPVGLDAVALTGLYAANSDAIYQLDLTGRFVHGNESLCTITGYDVDELRELTFREIVHPDDLPRVEDAFQHALVGERRRYLMHGLRKDGTVFAADVTKFPVHADDGTVIAILGVARDLEPVRESLLATDRMATLLRIAGRLSRLAGWSIEVPDWDLSWSDQLYELVDATPQDGTPTDITRRMMTPADFLRVESAFRACARNGTAIELRVKVHSLTGRELTMQVVGEAVADADNVITRLHGGFADITNALAEQEAMLRSEQRLRSTLDQIEDGICFLDRDWRLTFLNQAAAATSGLTVEEAATRTVWEMYPEIAGNEVGRLYRAAMERGESGTVRTFTTHFARWFEVSATPTDDGIATIIRDVTGDERRRQKLAAYTRDVEAQAALIEATADAMIVTALDGTIESWNRAAERIYGWQRDEAIGTSIHTLLDDEGEASEAGQRLREFHPPTRSGQRIIVERRRQLLEGTEGAPDRFLYVDTDISDLFADRAQARAVERRLQTTLDQITDGVCFLDRDWNFTFVNQAGERIMQTPRSVALGASIWELYPALRATEFGIAYRRTMDERLVSTARDFYPHLETWFEITSYPTDEGIMIYFKDVTSDERTQHEINAQNRLLRDQSTLIDAARDAMLVRGLDHVVRYWNAAAVELYGWTAEEAIGRSVLDMIYPDSVEFDRAQQAVLADGYWTGEFRQLRRDRSTLIVDARLQLVRDDDGAPLSIFAVHSDVTELRKEQERNIRAQRMESLGTLAGGIAHDLNNVLTPILMSVQLLRSGESDADRVALLDSMDAGVQRGADMIRQVLSFARGIEGAKAVIPLQELLDEVVSFGRDTLPKSITADLVVVGTLWDVVGDRTQLMQVLVNLVTNARDAMPDGGRISIRARNVTLDEQYQAVASVAPPGRYVSIDVEDMGEGMSAEIQSKIFEPFFTTKPQGSGTGLGLPTSMAIIRGHDGYMQVYSEPGQGSRFQIHLPAAEVGAAEAAVAEPKREVKRGNGERILVIDDEAAIRQIVSQTLTANGYQVLVAGNGREGIDILDAAADPIDLVVTDMMMPVLDGAATAQYLMEHHPGIPVIATSGLNAHGAAARVRELGLSHFIAKPFTADTLLSSLREALDAR